MATTGATREVQMKKSGLSTADHVEQSLKLGGNRLSTMVARFVALLRFQYTTERTYKKTNLKSKYDIQ